MKIFNRQNIGTLLLIVGFSYFCTKFSSEPYARIKKILKTEICITTVHILKYIFKYEIGKEFFKILLIPTCKKYNFKSLHVCKGFYDMYFRTIDFVFEDVYLNSTRVCNNYPLFGLWSLNMTKILESRSIQKPLNWSYEPKSFIQILQISDIHLDLCYKEKTYKNCEEQVCCRNTSTPFNGSYELSGIFGEFYCDAPPLLVESLFKYIKKNIAFDYIYWNGDVPPHDDPFTSQKEKNKLIEMIYKMIKSYFPDHMVLPVIGNHETYPLNTFPHQLSDHLYPTTYLYKLIADLSKDWLDQDAFKTFSRGGFYTMLLRPKFRVVVLNSNFCDKYNFMMSIINYDPFDQLSWLMDVLLGAESNGERVHLLMHHVIGNSECHESWSRNLHTIVSRFKNTVVAQFSGHLHNQHFKVLLDPETQEIPENIIYIAPSITTYHANNPGFALYRVDSSSESNYVVTDVESHYMDIDRSNKLLTPIFINVSSIRHYFNLKNTSPKEWFKLKKSIISDEKMYQRFLKFFHHQSNNRFKKIDKKEFLCQLLTNVADDLRLCIKSIPEYSSN